MGPFQLYFDFFAVICEVCCISNAQKIMLAKNVANIFISVPTHFFICGFLYPLSIKSAGMKLNFEGTR